MKTIWLTKCSAQDFVELFDKSEQELIVEACDEFMGWENLISFSVSEQLMIGNAASINYLFTNSTDASVIDGSITPINYIDTLMVLINSYKWICVDNYVETNDEYEPEQYQLWYDKAQMCSELLRSLSSI